MVCERRDRFEIAKIFDEHGVDVTHTIANSVTDEEAATEEGVITEEKATVTATATKKNMTIRPMIDEEV